MDRRGSNFELLPLLGQLMGYDSWAALWAATRATRDEKERGRLGKFGSKKRNHFLFQIFL
jgi:hypothetical protein